MGLAAAQVSVVEILRFAVGVGGRVLCSCLFVSLCSLRIRVYTQYVFLCVFVLQILGPP